MADIFEIKGINAEVKILGKSYKFADPKFKDKVLLRKEAKEIESRRSQSLLSEEDYYLEMYDVTRKMIKQFLPELGDDVLDQIGDNATMQILKHCQDLAAGKFNSVVSTVEGKSEAAL